MSVVIITGGGRGIGASTAMECARRGLGLILTYNSELDKANEVLARYMAKEFAERRIRVNSVSPGAIRTEPGGGLNDKFEAMPSAQTALSRVGEPEALAPVIATLPTEDGAWINAQNIEVAGGHVI
ncbi:MAG TPA: hypothetical protein DCW29_21805 [Janthinobacterium sp.]|nr:hypothetical protein [Janthinobacterium sp.]